jgi:hypothetical protein
VARSITRAAGLVGTSRVVLARSVAVAALEAIAWSKSSFTKQRILGSRFMIERGVNAVEISARSLVWRGGSVKLSQSGPFFELKLFRSVSTRFTPS